MLGLVARLDRLLDTFRVRKHMAKEFVSDIEKVRDRTREHLEEGASTSDRGADRAKLFALLDPESAMEAEHADEPGSLLEEHGMRN